MIFLRLFSFHSQNAAGRLSSSQELPGNLSATNRAEEMFAEGRDSRQTEASRGQSTETTQTSVTFISIQIPNKALMGGQRDSGW
jgi:hypothetical protein